MDPEIIEVLLERDPGLDRRRIIDWNDALMLGGPSVDLPYGELNPPSRAVSESFAAEEQAQQHRNPQTRWEANDLNDLVYISVAVGYCDVVVTERRWAANLNASDVPRRRNTTVLARLADLPEILVA